jgi:hypothetical protein
VAVHHNSRAKENEMMLQNRIAFLRLIVLLYPYQGVDPIVCWDKRLTPWIGFAGFG